MVVKKDNQFAFECQSKAAPECPQHGDLCDTPEEAEEWVEDECWIPTGEGYICPDCNSHHMRNLVTHRREMAQDEGPDDDDEPTIELEVGIDDQSG